MTAVIGDFSFLSPQGLWLLAALAIPILIHLFSRSKGKHVLIGDIELIRQARKDRVREVRLSQWLLLLLRMLIVATLTLLMADLVRQGLEDRTDDSAYVTPQWLAAATEQEKQSLLAGSSQNIYLLADGLPEINPETIELVLNETSSSRDASAWAYLSEALATINHQGAVSVYATSQASDWPARRLDLPRDVSWNLLEGDSELSGQPVSALIVFDRQRANDARLMEMAMEALRQHRVPNLSWSSIVDTEAGTVSDRPDWLVWLSDEDIPTELSSPSGTPVTILTDRSIQSAVPLENRPGTSSLADTKINLHRVHSNLEAVGDSVAWEMDNGYPLLTRTQSGTTRILNFASRFSTSWTDLQLQAEFPGLLLRTLHEEAEQYAAFPASIEYSQAVRGGSESGKTQSPSRSMHFWLAMLLAALWMTERWLSERQHRD